MPQDATSSYKESSSKIEETILSLTHLLNATTSAEELTQTWTRSSSETLQQDGPRLQDLRRALDAGKVIQRSGSLMRGMPMWIVVRMCKATWHQDGTWPLLGADEEASPTVQSMGIVRSTHSSAIILRPEGSSCFQVPKDEADQDNHHRQRRDVTAEEIAASYRARGLQVEEAEPISDDW